MGGKAFAHSGPGGSPLHVPRMPPRIYNQVAKKVEVELVGLFLWVTIPRPAPGKLDHGDIDFVVAHTISPWSPNSIKEMLGAEYYLNNGHTHSYAVPYADFPGAYVQVDVEVLPEGNPNSQSLFEWTKFMKSDSDLMQILGVCHRSLGLTCNDKGLHVRVEEVESRNKKGSMIFLTQTPMDVLEFYGLDSTKYFEGFATETELFDWIAAGRFFHPDNLRDRIEKANDRQRMRKRAMYARFITDYVPNLPQDRFPSSDLFAPQPTGLLREEMFAPDTTLLLDYQRLLSPGSVDPSLFLGDFSASVAPFEPGLFTTDATPTPPTTLDGLISMGISRRKYTRQEVLQEALLAFNKQDKYYEIIAEYNAMAKEELLWTYIKDHLHHNETMLGLVIRGLKFWVDFDHMRRPFIRSTPHENPPRWSYTYRDDLNALVVWVKENITLIKELERQRSFEVRQRAPPSHIPH